MSDHAFECAGHWIVVAVVDGKDEMKYLMMMWDADVPDLEQAATLSSTWSPIRSKEVDATLENERLVRLREDAMN